MQDVEGLYFLPAAKLIDYGKLELINEGYSSKGHIYWKNPDSRVYCEFYPRCFISELGYFVCIFFFPLNYPFLPVYSSLLYF